MDNQTTQKAVASPDSQPQVQAPASNSLPPIGKLFSESFNTLKASVIQMVILFLSVFGLSFLLLIPLMIVMVLAIALKVNLLFLFIIPIFLALIAIGFIFQIGTILINDSPKTYSIKEIYKKSIKLILPFIAVSIVWFFLVVPAFFVFIIPGIIVSILFTFALYELVIGNRGVLDSFRRSVYVVKSNFSGIFIRLFLMWLIGIGIVVLEIIAGNISPILILLLLILRIFFFLFSISFGVTLYKHAEAATPDKEGRSKLLGFVLLAIGGLVVFVLFIIAIAGFVSSNPKFQEAIVNEVMKSQNENSNFGDNPAAEGMFKEAYKSTFISSCTQDQSEYEPYCTCVANHLTENYSVSELESMSQELASGSTNSTEIASAQAACSAQAPQ